MSDTEDRILTARIAALDMALRMYPSLSAETSETSYTARAGRIEAWLLRPPIDPPERMVPDWRHLPADPARRQRSCGRLWRDAAGVHFCRLLPHPDGVLHECVCAGVDGTGVDELTTGVAMCTHTWGEDGDLWMVHPAPHTCIRLQHSTGRHSCNCGVER